MSLISSRIALVFLMGGLMSILILGMFFNQPLLVSLIFLAGLIVALTFLHNVKWGIFLILFIRPLMDKFGEQFTINLTENIKFNTAAVFGMLVIVLLSVFLFKNKGELKDVLLKKYWFIFLLMASASIFISIEKVSSIYEILRILSIFLFFASACIFVKTEKSPEVILNAIIFSALIPFISATYQLITKTGLGGTEGLESRLFGTFSHPNPFASFVVIVLAVAIYLIFQEKDFWRKWLLGIFIVWGILILEQTYARGAWLAFLIFLTIVTLKKSPKILLGIILFSLALFFFSETAHDRIEDIYNPPADSSIRWRFAQWEKMYGVFLEKPLTGFGIGTEIIVHEKEFGFNSGNQYTHNDLLRIALETGIFGFLAYFVLLFATLVQLIILYRKEKNPLFKDFGLFVLALFIALLSFSQTNNTLRETVTQWTLWVLIAVSLATHQLSEKNNVNSAKSIR
jgi:O-antigen ligase